jgi:hypothetical protein
MAWSWSHAPEAYFTVYENLQDLDRDTLCVVFTEWKTALEHEGEFFDGWYDQSLAEIQANDILTNDILANVIWDYCSQDHNVGDQWYGRTCDNGGFNAWICPYGCHTVSFDRAEDKNE